MKLTNEEKQILIELLDDEVFRADGLCFQTDAEKYWPEEWEVFKKAEALLKKMKTRWRVIHLCKD